MKRMIHILLMFFGVVFYLHHQAGFARSAAVGGRADVVLISGKILTVDKNFSIHQAVAIQNGRFVAVGTDQEIRLWIGPKTRVVNLAGRTVIPGLNDSHIHATVAGLTWDTELRWGSTRSLADGLKQIEAAAKEKPPGSWIVVAGGWTPEQFTEKRLPTRVELDAVAPKNPVFVLYLRQAAVLNAAALSAVGINRQSQSPAGGTFERDPKTGELTGVLQGVPAWNYAYKKIPQLTLDKVRDSFRNCFLELNRLGITSISDFHTAGVTFAHRRVLADMSRGGVLTLRMNYYVAPNDPGDELEQLRTLAAEVKQLVDNDTFHFAGFGETLIRGTGDGDVLSNPQGITIDPVAKEKFRKVMRFFAESGYNFHLHTTRSEERRVGKECRS